MKSDSVVDTDIAPWPYCLDEDDDYIEPYDETEDVIPCRNDWDYGL